MEQNIKKDKNESSGSAWGSLRRHFLTGFAALFPLFVTAYIILAIIGFADHLIGNYINTFLRQRYGFSVPGLGLAIAVVIVFGVGLVYNMFLGRKVFGLFESLFKRLPLVDNIYPSAKQLSDFMFDTEKKGNFKKVVLVQFPEKGTMSVGFITNEKVGRLQKESDKELVSVFVPLAPAPFSGHILLVPRDRFYEIDMPIDDAIRFVVSGGVVLPTGGESINKEKR